jgi:hypothetical protein
MLKKLLLTCLLTVFSFQLFAVERFSELVSDFKNRKITLESFTRSLSEAVYSGQVTQADILTYMSENADPKTVKMVSEEIQNGQFYTIDWSSQAAAIGGANWGSLPSWFCDSVRYLGYGVYGVMGVGAVWYMSKDVFGNPSPDYDSHDARRALLISVVVGATILISAEACR